MKREQQQTEHLAEKNGFKIEVVDIDESYDDLNFLRPKGEKKKSSFMRLQTCVLEKTRIDLIKN